jgi:hypothetical protein
MVDGGWWLVVGGWWLVVGGWWLGGQCPPLLFCFKVEKFGKSHLISIYLKV